MGKYRALTDMPPVKKGDVVEFKEPLVDGLKNHYVAVGDSEGVAVIGEDARSEIEGLLDLNGNVSREDLKKRATELELDFAPNIPTAKLLELVKEAQEAQLKDNGEGAGANEE